jgi:hypothetical protein
MSTEVIVVPGSDGGEPPAVQAAENTADAELGLAAGAALVTAEAAAATAEEAIVEAEAATAVAEVALEEASRVQCCEHCYAHEDRLSALEAVPEEPIEVVVDDGEVEVFDAPAPMAREPRKRAAAGPRTEPAAGKRGWWPV